MLHRKKWMPIAVTVILVQAILEGFALFSLATLNMLPDKYMLVVVLCMALSLVVTAILLFSGMKKHRMGRARRARRIIAIILAAVFGVGSVIAASMTQQLKTSVNEVTDNEGTLSAMVGVYVMADNPAKAITDVKQQANAFRDSVIPAMNALRAPADEIESLVGEKYWPYPTYGALLFYVK